jgi:ribosomal protein S18 acetylase RimI-like enzyme
VHLANRKTDITAIDLRADAENIAALVRRSFDTVAKEFGLTPENSPSNPAFTTASTLVDRLAKPNCFCFAAYRQGAPAGFVGLMPAGNGDGGAYEITRLAVLPEHRHLGLGKALLDTASRKARELGAVKVVIGIINDNSVLKNWYKAYGFVETEQKEYPFLPFVVCEMELGLDTLS